MSNKIKLYDLRNRDYPNKRGDVFRSLQVFECYVCGALSNEVVMGGWPGYGVRVICPQSSECWHHALEDKINAMDESLDKKMKDMVLPFLAEIKDDYVFEKGATEVYMSKDGAGDIRTKIPYRCRCGALTNRVDIKERRGKEIMTPICPQVAREWHRRLMKKFSAIIKKMDGAVKSIRKPLQEKIKNNLIGDPDTNLKKSITNVRSRKMHQECPHL